MEDFIYQIEVPQEEVTEIKNGKRQLVKRNVFPGYLLVRMDMSDESWSAVRYTPAVTGFVGPSSSKPSPLTLDEVFRFLAPATKEQKEAQAAAAPRIVDFEVGESVTVTDGAVRHAAREHQRDQRRPAEAQSAGVDLRSRDPGRALSSTRCPRSSSRSRSCVTYSCQARHRCPSRPEIVEKDQSCPRRRSSRRSSSSRSRPAQRRLPRRSGPPSVSTASTSWSSASSTTRRPRPSAAT